tara:strand:+ start:627 stop:1697 length:1071 start_codon:yes stop_codon:yes gene_type:complete
MAFKKNDNEVYIIGEIGQNHNGDIDVCKKLIDQLVVYSYDEITGDRLNTINAIKLIKRHSEEEMSNEVLNRPYNSPNSFGKTYWEHREYLEFSYEQHVELGEYIRSKGIDFVNTLCSPKTLRLLDDTVIDKVKVASKDLTNIPFLIELAKRKVPVILSTGMASSSDLDEAVKIFEKYKSEDLSILHCISQYPAEFDRLNLLSINKLIDKYGDRYTIGYSDHSMGIHVPIAAVAMGARIIEKHVTLDRSMKGTDHPVSAEPHEMKQMIHDIRTLESSFGQYDIFRDEACLPNVFKLSKSLATKNDMKEGDLIKMDDLHLLSPGDGLKWTENDLKKVVGKKITKDMEKNTILRLEDIV